MSVTKLNDNQRMFLEKNQQNNGLSDNDNRYLRFIIERDMYDTFEWSQDMVIIQKLIHWKKNEITKNK